MKVFRATLTLGVTLVAALFSSQARSAVTLESFVTLDSLVNGASLDVGPLTFSNWTSSQAVNVDLSRIFVEPIDDSQNPGVKFLGFSANDPNFPLLFLTVDYQIESSEPIDGVALELNDFMRNDGAISIIQSSESLSAALGVGASAGGELLTAAGIVSPPQQILDVRTSVFLSGRTTKADFSQTYSVFQVAVPEPAALTSWAILGIFFSAVCRRRGGSQLRKC